MCGQSASWNWMGVDFGRVRSMVHRGGTSRPRVQGAWAQGLQQLWSRSWPPRSVPEEPWEGGSRC